MTINEVLKRIPKIDDLLKDYCYAKIYGAGIGTYHFSLRYFYYFALDGICNTGGLNKNNYMTNFVLLYNF